MQITLKTQANIDRRCRPAAAAVALCSALVVAATAAEAETPTPRRFDVGLSTGFVAFSEVSGLGDANNPRDVPGSGPLLALHGGTQFLDGKLGVEATARLAFSTLRSGESTAKVLNVRAMAQWNFATDGMILPYVAAGYGQEVLFNSKPLCPKDGTPLAGCMLVKTPEADSMFAFGGGAVIPLSFRAGLRAQLLWLPADGRPGVAKIANDFEGTLGVVYHFGGPPEDSDKDGIADEIDKCPTKAEDLDGFEDSDGCPEEDNDNDGVFDAKDKCPNVPEDKDGFQDDDGCPDPDNDGDGIPDAKDKCPDKPETKNGYQDDDGCPDVADTDGDGILLPADKCPNQAEDKDGFEDDDGCPEADNDRDGILDAQDKCPNQPETKNGFQDEDGCPDKLPEGVQKLVEAPVNVLEFKADKLGKGADTHLMPFLEFLLEHGAIKLQIAVEADADTDDAKKLAQTRSEAIKAWLIDQGVEKPERILPVTGPVAATPPKATKGVSKPMVHFKLL